MGLFKDHSGNEWRLAFTPAVLERIAESEKCDPNEVMSGPVDLVIRGEGTVQDMYGLLWLILEPQAETKGIDHKQFFALSFDLIEDVYPAMRDAVINFTPPLKQGMLRAALEKADSVMTKAEKIFRQKLEDDDRLGLDEAQLMKQMNEAIEKQLGASQKEPMTSASS
jgi:hypothetical protein